jgi:hypothetical protein
MNQPRVHRLCVAASVAAVLTSTVTGLVHAQAPGRRPDVRVDGTEAAADTAERGERSRVPARTFFAGASLGLGWAHVRHHELATPELQGVMVAIHAGYSPTPRFWFALELTSLEERITRRTAGESWSADGQGPSQPSAQPLAGCSGCRPKVNGGQHVGAMLHVMSVGPRVEVTPFGRDGVYLGGAVGASIFTGVESSYGLAGTARAGFRVRVVEPLTVAIEGGGQGHVHDDADALVGFGMVQGRAHF